MALYGFFYQNFQSVYGVWGSNPRAFALDLKTNSLTTRTTPFEGPLASIPSYSLTLYILFFFRVFYSL